MTGMGEASFSGEVQVVPGDPKDRVLGVDVVEGRAFDTAMKQQVLSRLLKVWEAHPALRLGQLLGNVYHSTDPGGVRLYYEEDLPLISAVEKFYP